MSQLELEKALLDLLSKKKKYDDVKLLLRKYKIKSDRLTQLMSAKKDLQAQINEEKERIENEMLEDQDYADAVESEKKLKLEIKEKTEDIREILANTNPEEPYSNYDYVVDGEKLSVHTERQVKYFINGKEQK